MTTLMPRCTNTSFLLTPHYIRPHRNSDNLHNAISVWELLSGMADKLLIVVLHHFISACNTFILTLLGSLRDYRYCTAAYRNVQSNRKKHITDGYTAGGATMQVTELPVAPSSR